MEERFKARLEEMEGQAQVSSEALAGVPERLVSFVAPFAALLVGQAPVEHVEEYITGLLSKLKRKTSEGIAYLLDKGRQGLQKFIGVLKWDHRPLVDELCRQVGEAIGEADGVIVFDPSAHAKKGEMSVGVARQWSGRWGKIDNCQVGIYMAYVSRKEHALVDVRLYLPEEWTKDRKRCKAAGVPKGTKFRTRHELALEMLDAQGKRLPHGWVAGDDEMGRSSWFRGELRRRGERYLLDMQSNTRVCDLEAEPPESSGDGPRPKPVFVRVDEWAGAQPKDAWKKITVRDGEKGPLEVEAVKRRVRAKTDQSGNPADEVLFVTREKQSDGTWRHDYHLAYDPQDSPLEEYARVAKAEHRVEECIERSKGEAGLSDYQVRNWDAWHHHQILSLIAAWFLVEETRRGKNPDTGNDRPPHGRHDRQPARASDRRPHARSHCPPLHPLARTQRTRPLLPPHQTQTPAKPQEPAQPLGKQ